jgi:hypothetical protein
MVATQLGLRTPGQVVGVQLEVSRDLVDSLESASKKPMDVLLRLLRDVPGSLEYLRKHAA